MLQAIKLEKHFGARQIFKDLTFSLSARERLALVGRNGCGKSTLFRLILGEESPDSGSLVLPKGYRIGHLSQHLTFSEESILKEACRGLRPESEGEEYRAEVILDGLGFSAADMELPASHFSGGFQIRVELARVLVSEPNLLLLDEPTNYLDIVSARWLEEFLREWPNEMIIISHDRTFLDAVSTHTMIIHRGEARKIQGGTKKLYDLLAQDDVIYEQTRLNQEKKRKEMEEFVNRFKAKAGTASLAQSRAKMLEKMDIGEELREEPELDFRFTNAPFVGKAALEVQGLSFSYPAQRGNPPFEIVKNLNLAILPGDRIAVIGKNGKGKSTLLRLLAGELTPSGGDVRRSPHTALGYFGQTNIQRLTESLTVEDEIFQTNPKLARAQVRAICGTMMFSGDDALKRIKVLSGGEKSRVLLGKLLAQPTNLLLLDEPTNHLDLESIAALVESLERYDGAVVLVTHDEYMLKKLARRIVLFAEQGAELIEHDYDYFLSTRGWEERAQNSSTPQSAATHSSHKIESPTAPSSTSSALQKRGQSSMGKSQRAVQQIEKKIIALEGDIKRYEQEMVEASGQRNYLRVAELGKASAKAREEIERLFEELGAV